MIINNIGLGLRSRKINNLNLYSFFCQILLISEKESVCHLRRNVPYRDRVKGDPMLDRMRRQLGHFRLQVSFGLSHILDPFSATEPYRAMENHTQDLQIALKHSWKVLNQSLDFSCSQILAKFLSFWCNKFSFLACTAVSSRNQNFGSRVERFVDEKWNESNLFELSLKKKKKKMSIVSFKKEEKKLGEKILRQYIRGAN